MSFSDSDWEYAGQAPAQRSNHAWLWSLVAGVAVGAAAATLVLYNVDLLRTDATHDSAILPRARPALPIPAPARSASAPATKATHDGAAVAPLPAPLPASTTAAPPALAEPLMPQPPAAGPARRPLDEARRKELAWARFYQRPAYCDGNPSTDQLIDCANHYIRSKREFDQRYAEGKL